MPMGYLTVGTVTIWLQRKPMNWVRGPYTTQLTEMPTVGGVVNCKFVSVIFFPRDGVLPYMASMGSCCLILWFFNRSIFISKQGIFFVADRF